MSGARRLLLVAAAALGLTAWAFANEDQLRLQQDPANWPINNGNYAGWNYSPLDQINTSNVQDLVVAWTFQTGILDNHEAEPLVVGDTMYLVTPKPNTVYALDLGDSGRIKWSYVADQPELETAIARACCGAQTRGLAYGEGKVIINTLDGQVIALDAETGQEVWKVQNADLSIGETMTTAPLVVHDHVIVGVAGAEYAIRGHVTAYALDDGERLWRAYNIGPDEDMLITDRFKPFYPDDKVEDVGVSTWYGDSWKRGGASIWGWFTYDPESDLFYYGTGNCAPWNPDYRRDPATAPGLDKYTNKYCASVLARDATTGELVWAYSLTPQDQWDYDSPAGFLVVDLEIGGELRKALVHQNRNGYVYVFDRLTGEILVEPWAWTNVTWADGIDMETGRPRFRPEAIAYTGGNVELLCPFSGGNWEQQSYSPQTGLFYFTGHNSCGENYGMRKGEYVPGQSWTLFVSGGFTTKGNPGKLWAVDPATGEEVWSVDMLRAGNKRPVFTTGGNLLIQGSQLGTVDFYDATTGELLWQFRAGSGFRNSPISFLGPDGKQYIAIISSSAPSSREVAYDEPPDAASRYSRPGSTLYVFTLPD
ncbi:MAG TPA: PQQ-dependent dehydrogenase, methanol/ethanol family [Trueperaceae bacterium]